MGRSLLATALLVLVAYPAYGEDAGDGADRNSSLLGGPADLQIRAEASFSLGVAGFGIDADPFESRLDFPLDGNYLRIRAEIRPFGDPGKWAAFLDISCLPEFSGRTEDTDWFRGRKWLFSRTDTSGYSAGIRIGASSEIFEDAGIALRLGASLLYQRDVFAMSELRQYCYMTWLTNPPMDAFMRIFGEVARFELRGMGAALDFMLSADLCPDAAVRFSGSLFPVFYSEGRGNWKLRKYRFFQYGVSAFTSHMLRAEVVLRLAPWAELCAGAERSDLRADFCSEDGTYADAPEYDYENADIVTYLRRLQYGFFVSVSLTL